MQRLRGFINDISQQYRSQALGRRKTTFDAIMIHYAQVVWHFDAMYTNFTRGVYNVACYHAACVDEHYSNFTILFCDLRFESRNPVYCDALHGIINMNNDYPRIARSIINDSHERVHAMCVVPPYVSITVSITYAVDENDVECDDDVWRACGVFFCYLNLVRTMPVRAVGENYLARMRAAAVLVEQNERLFSLLCIAEHVAKAAALVETLSANDMGQPIFDIEIGNVPRIESIL